MCPLRQCDPEAYLEGNRPHKIESLFVFMGGIITQEAQINLPKEEISTYQFLEPEVAVSILGIRSQRRLKSCLPYLDSQTTVYLENGQQT